MTLLDLICSGCLILVLLSGKVLIRLPELLDWAIDGKRAVDEI